MHSRAVDVVVDLVTDCDAVVAMTAASARSKLERAAKDGVDGVTVVINGQSRPFAGQTLRRARP
jgi:hypothetical protein